MERRNKTPEYVREVDNPLKIYKVDIVEWNRNLLPTTLVFTWRDGIKPLSTSEKLITLSRFES